MKTDHIFILLLMTVQLCLYGCAGHSELEEVLAKAGSNRAQLESVLRHFENDERKYAAASYLIQSMPYHYTSDGVGMKDYMKCYHLFAEKGNAALREVDSISDKNDGFRNNWSVKRDIENVDSTFLISYIETAFSARDEFPWSRHLPDSIFNRYVLPYRVGNERLMNWRDSILTMFKPLVDSLVNKGESNSLEVAKMVLDEWNKIDYKWTGRLPSGISLGMENICNHAGSCVDYAHALVYLMRSFGIPSGIDYVSVRGQNNSPHSWPFILDTVGNCHYSEVDDKTWLPAPQFGIKAGKIYREEFGMNAPMRSDVSSVYYPGKVYDVTLQIPENASSATLCIGMACYRDWVPVAYGEKVSGSDESEVVFKEMLGGVIYCMGELEDNGFKPLFYPFEIDTITGGCRFLQPGNRGILTGFSKFPVDSFNGDMVCRMLGGVIEGSDSRSFSKVDTLHVIRDLPKRKVSIVNLEKPATYRYYRYRGGKDSFSNISELGFYQHYGDMARTVGKIFGTPGSWGDNPDYTFDKAFDNNTDTSFDCVLSEGEW